LNFGLSVVNDGNYVQIDSEQPRLCALYSGTYQASGSSTAYVTFPAAITTPEPPCIFIRNTPDRPDDLYTGMTISGGPGNWTGFVLTTINIDYRPYGKWFAAVFASITKADYGLRMWDANSSVIFDSGATPVLFTKASSSWSFQGKVQINPIANGYYWRNSLTAALLADEYFMINPFSRGLLTPTHINWTPIGVRFNYSQSCLQVFGVTALGAWSNMGMPGAVFARLPGT
jgi:hypothetical protein